MTAGPIPFKQGLVISLEQSLKTAFNQPDLRLTRPTKARKHRAAEFRLRIENYDKEVQDDAGVVHLTKSVLSEDGHSSDFYFGFVGTFAPITDKTMLQHASLSVFYDLLAGELVPVFRAEWDAIAASDETSKHAQPHWHFVQSPSRVENLVRTMITAKTEFASESDGQLFGSVADFGKFHFAMASLLPRKGITSHKEMYESKDFTVWFDSLVSYVAGQIAYVASKMSKPSTTDFVPA